MSGKSTKKDNLIKKEVKGTDIMPTVTKIIKDEESFVLSMKVYVETLKKSHLVASPKEKEKAKKDAVKALKKTGVINNNGTVKKKIVTWE